MQAVLTQLSRQDAEALIVLDNAEDWTEASRPRPLPKGSHIRWLATTRNTHLGATFFRCYGLEAIRTRLQGGGRDGQGNAD